MYFRKPLNINQAYLRNNFLFVNFLFWEDQIQPRDPAGTVEIITYHDLTEGQVRHTWISTCITIAIICPNSHSLMVPSKISVITELYYILPILLEFWEEFCLYFLGFIMEENNSLVAFEVY